MQTDIVERLTEMVANVGRDWRSGEEFLRSGHQSVVDGIREAAKTIATLRREVEQARANAWIIEVDDGVLIARQGTASITVTAETATVYDTNSAAPATKMKLDEFFIDQFLLATPFRSLSDKDASS